jgi:hypothetical protein
MGIPGHLSIRTVKLSDQERRIVAELHPSDGLGKQRMQQFRASVHFAATKDQAELVFVVERSMTFCWGSASRIRLRNAICRCLNSGPAMG